MSTDLRPIPDIPFIKLFDGRLEKHGAREKVIPGSTAQNRYLVGGDGVLEVYEDRNGNSSFCLRGFAPVPWTIFDALTREFEVELVSEHDHRFWGFATKEEERDFHEKMGKESEDEFYNDLIHYLRGEPNELKTGTVGMLEAKIAMGLVASDASLLAPNNRQQLLEAIKAVYDRDHAITVAFTEKDKAAFELMVARRTKLPQA
jgi:hypothetical protein